MTFSPAAIATIRTPRSQVLADLCKRFGVKILYPPKDGRIRGPRLGTVVLDDCDGPWTARTVFAQSRSVATAAERSLILLGRPSREVALSFIGAQC